MKKFHWIVLVVCFTTRMVFAQTFCVEYGANDYAKTVEGVGYRLSIPALHGQQMPVIRGVVVSHPGLGSSTAFKVNERWVRWLHDNGLAYLGNDSPYSSGSLNALASFAGDSLGGILYPELQHVPILVFGPSAGGSATTADAWNDPLRCIAFVVEHTRIFLDVYDFPQPAAAMAVPGYFRWGEWDHLRFWEGYQTGYGGDAVSAAVPTSAKVSIHAMMAQGAQWMAAMEHRQDHASQRHAIEEAMGFFGLMLPLRYAYEEGVAGKDPRLGPVNLIPLAREDGWMGEHNFGAIQTRVTLNGSNEIDPAASHYANFLRDWQSADPYAAPFADFGRLNKHEGHSWMANGDLAAFWATKFSEGHFDLDVEFVDLITDDLGTSAVVNRNSLFPNVLTTAQSVRVRVRPDGFPGVERVEFYRGQTLLGQVSQAPYEFTCAFAAGDVGMQVLYPVAVAANGERRVGPRRMVQVVPNTRGANTAPAISPIGIVEGQPGQTLSIPFTVADADGDALTVVWREVNRAGVASGSYSAGISGSGTSRSLDLTLPATPGVIWGLVRVYDGDISVNAAVTLRVGGDGSSPPFFVGAEALGLGGRGVGQNALGAWSKKLSVRVHDFDTDPALLTLTAVSSNPAAVPQENIRIGGTGSFRSVQVKPLGYATITLTLSDGNSSVTESFALTTRTADNTPPVISAIPDMTLPAGQISDPVTVRVYDIHQETAEMAFTVVSADPALIPNENIVVTQVGERRQIRITPAPGAAGTGTLMATVTDSGGLTASSAFTVTVTAPPALQTPPSLKVNLGAGLGAGWNSFPDFSIFGGAAGATLGNLVFADGTSADGVTLSMTRSTTSATHCLAISSQDATAPASDWLTDAAAGSFWFLNLNNGTPPHQLTFSVAGLPAGTYDLEAYVYVNPSHGAPANGYKFDSAGMMAGVQGTVAATDNPILSDNFNATTTGSVILRWRNLTVGEGDTLDLQTALPLNSKMPVLNAFFVRGTAFPAEGPTIVAQPAGATLQAGGTALLSVAATASEGALAYQWYQGVRGDTSTPVGTHAATLSTPVLLQTTGFWVRVSDDKGFTDSETAVMIVQQGGIPERILFIGNSFTNGYVLPMQSYNHEQVTDLNGSGYGGVPGILKQLADDTGFQIQVGIESVNGSTLAGRYPGKVNLVTDPVWDRYVLQGRSQEAMADWRGADAVASQFTSTVANWRSAILHANPAAEVWLYAPWASPRFVGETIDGVNIYYTRAEGTDAFLEEIRSAYSGAAAALQLTGWVPVGEAFRDALEAGLTPLWISDAHHASAAGTYLTAVMFYRHLLGGDPRYLPTGPGSAVAGLGLTGFQAETIHQLVHAFALSVPPARPVIQAQPQNVTVRQGESATLSVSAVPGMNGGDLRYQWYAGESGNAASPVGGATSASFITPLFTVPGAYPFWVRVLDDNGTADSQAAQVTVTPHNPEGTVAWIAYHNTEINAVNTLADSLITKGNAEGTVYALRNAADGSAADGATLTITRTGSWNQNSNAAAAMPAVGDVHELFGGKIHIDSRFNWAQTTATALLTFRNLPPGTYDLALALNRGNTGNLTRVTIQDVAAGASAFVLDGNNTNTGQVARWTGIAAAGEGGTRFSVLVQKESGSFHYLPQLIRLAHTPPETALDPETTRLYLDLNGTGEDHGVSAAEAVVWDLASAIWSPELYSGQGVNLDHDFTAPTMAWLQGARVALTGAAPMSPPITLKLAQPVSVRGIDFYDIGDYRFEDNGGDPVALTLIDNPFFDPGEYATMVVADRVQLVGDFRFRESRSGRIVLESSATPLPLVGTVTFYQGMLVIGANRSSADTHIAFAAGTHPSSLELEAETLLIGSLRGEGSPETDLIKPTNDAPALSTLVIQQSVDTHFTGDIRNSAAGGRELALHKSGGGSLTLTGNLSYTGGTLLSGGTLHVPGRIGEGDVRVRDGGALLLRAQAPSQIQGSLHLQDQAVLRVDILSGISTATVQGDLILGSGVLLQVSSGGNPPADGTYPLLTLQGTQTGGFAEVQIAGGKYGFLSRVGNVLTLTVSSVPILKYDTWIADYSLTGADAEDLADPDHDGIVNLLEYAFALHPNQQNLTREGLPAGGVREEGGVLFQTITFRRNRNAPDLIFHIQATEELTNPDNWQSLVLAPADWTTLDPDADGDGAAEIVEVQVNANGKVLRFLRLAVERE